MIKARPSIQRSIRPLEIGSRVRVMDPFREQSLLTLGEGGRTHGSRFATMSDFAAPRDLGLRPSARTLQLPHEEPERDLSPKKALNHLLEGNKRFVASELREPKPIASRRNGLSKAQHPFAIVVGCSDSRVAPEFIFDQNIGDLFVVREAGNVVDGNSLAGIEYALLHLGTPPLIVVLGHEKCGAVTAATRDGQYSPHIQNLIDQIKPAVAAVKDQKGDLLVHSIKENARRTKNQLTASSTIIKEMVEQEKTQIVTGYYHLRSGRVTFFE